MDIFLSCAALHSEKQADCRKFLESYWKMVIQVLCHASVSAFTYSFSSLQSVFTVVHIRIIRRCRTSATLLQNPVRETFLAEEGLCLRIKECVICTSNTTFWEHVCELTCIINCRNGWSLWIQNQVNSYLIIKPSDSSEICCPNGQIWPIAIIYTSLHSVIVQCVSENLSKVNFCQDSCHRFGGLKPLLKMHLFVFLWMIQMPPYPP